MSNLPHERRAPGLTETKVETPEVGDWAWQYGGLDPRQVSKVSKDSKRIVILIGDHAVGWLPVENYTFTRRA